MRRVVNVRWINLSLDHVEHFDVLRDLSALEVHTDRAEFFVLIAACGQPDFVFPYDGRRPTLIRNGNLPTNVIFFVEFDRQIRSCRFAVTGWTAELIPVFRQ